MEQFKEVKGYDKKYYIGNKGSILMCSSKECRRMHPNERKGYLRIGLSKFGKCKYFSVHRLVAEAFIPNPKNKSQVNHIDGNKHNNSSENLEWVTRSENQLHAVKIHNNEFNMNRRKLVRLTEEQVLEIRTLLKNKVPILTISKKYNKARSTIRDIRNGKSWSK